MQHFAISTEKMVAGEKNTTLRGKAKNEKGGKNGRKLHKKRWKMHRPAARREKNDSQKGGGEWEWQISSKCTIYIPVKN